MNDVIDYALMRHGELAEAIERREAEIVKLREEKEDLEQFVCTHKELSERADSRSKSRKAPQNAERTADPDSPVPQLMPVRQAKPA